MMLVPLDLRLVSLGRVSRGLVSPSDMSEELVDEGLVDEGLDSVLYVEGALVMVMVVDGSEGVGVVSWEPDKELISPVAKQQSSPYRYKGW